MIITIESTTKTVKLNGAAARVWEGKTETGIPVHCFVSRIAADCNFDLLQFERELKSCKPPSPEMERYPARMIL